MSVLLINGSPNEKRCTYTALSKAAEGLALFKVESEIAWIGKDAIRPCIGCGACNETQRCAFGADDGINELIEKIIGAEGLVLGSPVFYAGINGSFKATLDRVFFAASSRYAFKPGGAVVSARRAGTTAALEQLNKYLVISQMILAGSLYWPMVHGMNADQVLEDKEGVQTAYQLGANIGWLVRTLEAGRAVGIEPYRPESRDRTNFVR